MGYTMKPEGMEELSKMLTELGEKAQFVASMSLYDGAGAMADAINDEVRNIQTAPFKWAKNGETRLPSPEEKEILMQNGAIGIAKFEKDGAEVSTSVGFNQSGYADVNWNHMSSNARTNYKAQQFGNRENMTTSTLKAAGVYEKGVQNRKPVGVIANSINSGTSFMKKQPFMRKGISRGTKIAESAIYKTAEKLFNEIIQQNDSGGKSA